MKRTWWKEAVVYQVYWRSFYDTNGDGYGDIPGVIEKLDYIKDLGIDVIWLNPVYKSPDKDNGYDISDYQTIMAKAGTMNDLEGLIHEVHARGMKLIMDLVVNHTSDQHPWFQASRSSRNDPKRDWYIWKEPNPENGGPPNNWYSYFSSSAWAYDETTGQYYLHSFAAEQPDLNWENPEVRQAIYDMMKFWLDKGIDGFRMDVINLLAKQEGFPDAENPETLDYLGNNPGIHHYLQEMNREVLSPYNAFTVGEIPFVKPEDGVKYVGEDRGELDTLFHFEVADDMPEWNMRRFKEIQKQWYEGMKNRGWVSQFLNNHDHTRQVTRYGNDGRYRVESAKLLAAMLHTLPGTPYVFQGEEIGMTGVDFSSIHDYRDIAMKNKYREEVEKGRDPEEVLRKLKPLSRDNSRAPVQWNERKHGGFTAGTPWISVNSNFKEINVEKALENPESVFYFYKELIRLRKENDVMVYGDYHDYSEGEPFLYVYQRSLGTVTWLVILNHRDAPSDFSLPKGFNGKSKRLVLANYNDVTGKEDITETELRPHEARIYEFDTEK
ncbi:MAG TPA: alpha-glucosidase [Bacillales bacterium]|nr:alpha-glucosidase [Bacillales bacterium]